MKRQVLLSGLVLALVAWSCTIDTPSATNYDSTDASGTSESLTVYITKTGEKYHTATCSYLKYSKIAISLADAKAAGYTPCSVCNPPRSVDLHSVLGEAERPVDAHRLHNDNSN